MSLPEEITIKMNHYLNTMNIFAAADVTVVVAVDMISDSFFSILEHVKMRNGFKSQR